MFIIWFWGSNICENIMPVWESKIEETSSFGDHSYSV